MGKYLLSFTACPMRRPECVTIARSYLDLRDWKAVRSAIDNDDILMIRSLSSRKRIGLELCKRMRRLSEEELQILADCGDSAQESNMCWVAICRTYEFVRDFLDNVISARWSDGLGDLPQGAYEGFFSEASLTHPELETLSEGTRQRLRNQLFQMLREVGFINADGALLPYLVPFALEPGIAPEERRFFPTATFTE